MEELTVRQALSQGYKLCIAPDYPEHYSEETGRPAAEDVDSITQDKLRECQPIYLLEKESNGKSSSEGAPMYNRTDILLVADVTN